MSGTSSPRAPLPLAEALRAFRYHPDEDVSGLSSLPAPSGGGTPMAAPAAGVEFREYLSFELEKATYAVPLAAVLEILRAPPLLGVLDLRGTVTPVYDLGLGLGLRKAIRQVAGPPEECEAVPKEARILVARTATGPAGMWVESDTALPSGMGQ